MDNLYTINTDDHIKELVRNIYARENEIAAYQMNINNYKALLMRLPTQFPPHLVQYQDYANIDNVPLEDMQEVADLLFAKNIAHLLRTEMLEQNKSKHIYQALLAQIPEGFDLQSALLAEKEKNQIASQQ